MSLRDDIINEIIALEGGYVNNPHDKGGETIYGITIQTARINGYIGDMKLMPVNIAFDIYVKKYWRTVHGDVLAEISEDVAREVVDTAIHSGPSQAIIFLQRCLNALNDHQISVDGHIGNITIGALIHYMEHRTDKVILKMLNTLQGAFLIELVERRKQNKVFLHGWFNKRVVL